MQQDNFGKFIRYKRNLMFPNCSLNKFALDNDIEPAMLSRIENLKQDISHTAMKKIARGFKMNLSELIKSYEESDYYNSINT